MPELPEVETIKSMIEPQLQGLTIENVTVSRPEVIAYPAASTFCSSLTGQTISHMERRIGATPPGPARPPQPYCFE